jgi:hypothetical protein
MVQAKWVPEAQPRLLLLLHCLLLLLHWLLNRCRQVRPRRY